MFLLVNFSFNYVLWYNTNNYLNRRLFMNFDSIVKEYSTEDIISCIIKKQFVSPDTIQSLELLAKKLLQYNTISSNKELTFQTFITLFDKESEHNLTSSLAGLLEQAIVESQKNPTNNDSIFKSLIMQAQHQLHRGDGYCSQLISFANKLYGRFDDIFYKTLGFKYSTYSDLLLFVYRFYSECISWQISTLRIDKKLLYKHWNQLEIDNIISYLGIKFGTDTINFTKGLNPLYTKPILDFEEYIYFPLITSTLMNLPKVFHYTFIASKIFNKEAVAEYKKHRGDVIEELTIEFLSTIISSEQLHRSLHYPHKGDNEADVIVSNQEHCLLFECKSKILTLPALQGELEKIDKDVHDAIGKAYEQAIRTLEWIQSSGDFEIETRKGISKLTLTKPKKYFIICITAENFGCIPYDIEKYINIDMDLQIIPAVINIYDLEIILKESSSYTDFISYLEFRNKNYKQMLAVDELDVFGFYKSCPNTNFPKDNASLFPSFYSEMFDEKYDMPLI